MWEVLAFIVFVVLFMVWFIHGLTRPRNTREDPKRKNGEFDGHIVVKDWNKED